MYFKVIHPFTPKAAGVVEKSVVTCISKLHLIAFQFFSINMKLTNALLIILLINYLIILL